MTQFPSYLHVERTGEGPALVLMHGAGEDSSLLAPQAAAFAQRGFTVISYDRRGTGRSTRDGWPSGGVRQHVEDAADLISNVDGPVRVLGLQLGWGDRAGSRRQPSRPGRRDDRLGAGRGERAPRR